MYQTLLCLPLFQGLSREDVTRIIESTRLDFSTLRKGEVLCRQQQICDNIHFVIEGDIISHTAAFNNKWALQEQVGKKGVLGLEVLYGRQRTYNSTYIANGTTRILSIDKRTAGALFRYFEVMQIGAFNQLTTALATQERLLWMPPAITLRQRLVRFMMAHVKHPAGWKRFDISMATLGQYLGEDQRRISKALHEMQNDKLISLSRRAIEIPAFEKLLQN